MVVQGNGAHGISRVETLGNTSREAKEGMRGFKRIGMHSMPMRNEKKGSRASGISIESDIELNITRYRTHELHTRSNKRNNLENVKVQESQVLILWNCGLWAHIE